MLTMMSRVGVAAGQVEFAGPQDTVIGRVRLRPDAGRTNDRVATLRVLGVAGTGWDRACLG